MKTDPTQNVAISENYVDIQSKSAALVADTTTTLATIMGEAISANARGVTIYVGSETVHYNPVGAATTGNGILPSPYGAPGNKGDLDKIQLIGASGATPTVTVIVYGTQE